MKTLKVYDTVHTAVKVEAARSGRTAEAVASLLLEYALKLVGSGKIKLAKLAESEVAK